MNERIRELEAQCWEERKYGPAWFDSKKFAELIVRECAGVCNDARDSTDYVTTVGMADHCALAIMNRFGVK